jgi:5'-nucleotidase
MRLLLTNDDGIDAPGLAALERAARPLGEVVVAAPVGPYSGCGHQVTTRGPFRVSRPAEDRYAVEGTPADCVRVALHGLTADVDWVLSGVNAGGNLGADVYHSGTVAAVREAALHGRPGVAVSQYHRKGVPIDWGRAAGWVGPLLRDLLARPCPAGSFWNVNLPHILPGQPDPPVVFCPLDPNPLPLSFLRDGDLFAYDGDYHSRPRVPGADIDVCFGGAIAVTRLSLG